MQVSSSWDSSLNAASILTVDNCCKVCVLYLAVLSSNITFSIVHKLLEHHILVWRKNIENVTSTCKVIPSFLPCFLPPFPSSIYPSCLSFFPFFITTIHPSLMVYPSFLLSIYQSFLPSFIPSFLPFFLSSLLPYYLTSFLPSFLLPSIRPYLLPYYLTTFLWFLSILPNVTPSSVPSASSVCACIVAFNTPGTTLLQRQESSNHIFPLIILVSVIDLIRHNFPSDQIHGTLSKWIWRLIYYWKQHNILCCCCGFCCCCVVLLRFSFII